MKTFAISLATLLVVGLVACSGVGGSGGRPPSAPALEGQAALDAQATLAVWSAQGTAVAAGTAAAAQATADAQAASARATADMQAGLATGTAVAGLATGEAAAAATAAAQATATTSAVQATATWSALAVQAEAIAVQQTADAGAYFLSATATADAAIQAFMEAEAAQTVREREAAVARQQMWNRLTPWLLGAAVVVGGGLVALVVGGYVLERVRRARPQQAGDVYVMWHPSGPRVIAPPRPSLPRVEPRPLLTAGAVAAGQVADSPPVTLPRIDEGHVLIAGETGSGKSTAAWTVAATRSNVRVLDPHWNGRDWAGLEVIGGGRNFEAIREAIDEMRHMLSARYAERLDGRDEFEPFTIFVDEMPAIVAALGRDVRDFWLELLREGRKVGLYLVLLTQSTRVRTLGIEGEGDILRNFFAALVLGKLAEAEYPRLVAGMARPAVLHTLGGARPVVIPYPPAARPSAPPTSSVAPPQSTLPTVYATAEWPQREEPAIDLDHIDARARQRIIDEYRRELVLRRVQLKLFPQYGDDGGRAFYVIRDVLEQAGMIEPGPNGRYQPTPQAIGY